MIYWTARYRDGSSLPQLRPDGTRNTYDQIDRDNLESFVLHLEDGRLVAVIDFTDDTNGDPGLGPKRLIWRKRNQMNSGGGQVTLTLAGWQRKVAGRNVQSILYINEATGAIVLGGQWLEGAPMMHSIVPLECEPDLV